MSRQFSEFDTDSYVRAAAAEFGRRKAVDMERHMRDCAYAKPGASPIETMFGCALSAVLADEHNPWIGMHECYMDREGGQKFEEINLAPMSGFIAFPEVVVGAYRVDFMIVMRHLDNGTGWFAIECDGHEFHERTKEQAERDKRRGRELQARNIPVFRFTGSEIFRDAISCAEQALHHCYRAMQTRKQQS